MESEIRKQITKEFVLDKQKLNKINDFILKRRPNSNIKYTITKSNSITYNFDDIDEILNQNNFSDEKIESIEFNICEDDFVLRLEFNIKYYPFSLFLRAENHDNINNLSIELIKYIENTVCVSFFRHKIIDWTNYFLIISFIIVSIFINYKTSNYSRKEIFDWTIETDKIDEKINLIFEYLKSKSEKIIKTEKIPLPISFIEIGQLVIFYLLSIFWMFKDFTKLVINYLFPVNIFLIGEEINKFERSQSVKKILFNGLLIGIISSVIASIIMNLK